MSKRLLVACEESQTVLSAFRELGFEAWSCDLLPCSGPYPEFHIQDDCLKLIQSEHWDMLIGFPPCTYLSSCQGNLIFNSDHSIKDYDRFRKLQAASDFFYQLWTSDIPFICLENPRSLKVAELPVEFSQNIEPYFFGDSYRKRTRLFLKNLPPLFSTCLVQPEYSFVTRHSSSFQRSKFHPGVASAMASQWGRFLIN